MPGYEGITIYNNECAGIQGHNNTQYITIKYRQGGHARIQGCWDEGWGHNNTQQYTSIKYSTVSDAQIQQWRDGSNDLADMSSLEDIIKYNNKPLGNWQHWDDMVQAGGHAGVQVYPHDSTISASKDTDNGCELHGSGIELI